MYQRVFNNFCVIGNNKNSVYMFSFLFFFFLSSHLELLSNNHVPNLNLTLGFTVFFHFAGCSGEPVDMHDSFLHCLLCGPICVLCSIQVRFPCL